MSERTLLCPFDKNPCIGRSCAVWSEEGEICSFASLPDMVRVLKTNRDPVKATLVRRDTESSGSGKYRTLLFD